MLGIHPPPNRCWSSLPTPRGRSRPLLRYRLEFSSLFYSYARKHQTFPANNLFIYSVIATSGPSLTYPQRAYRNPLDSLVKFLDDKHKNNWAIWEFRAEGTGYPDEEVYGRIWHYPWPDHHPPPFSLIPNMMASMRNWLIENEERVVVVHCKGVSKVFGSACIPSAWPMLGETVKNLFSNPFRPADVW